MLGRVTKLLNHRYLIDYGVSNMILIAVSIRFNLVSFTVKCLKSNSVGLL